MPPYLYLSVSEMGPVCMYKLSMNYRSYVVYDITKLG